MSAWRGLRILFTAQAWKIWDFHQLEQRVTEVAQFYSSSSKKQLGSFKGSSIVKDREKEKQITSSKKHLDPNRREAASTKRMQELMRQFSTILVQITQHKWAWPFMQPVDVEGLGLHDYYELPIKYPELFESFGIAQPKVSLTALPYDAFTLFMRLPFHQSKDILLLNNVKKESCFFPVPQAKDCILRVVERANVPVIYLSTDAAESETDLLQALTMQNSKTIPLVKRPGHSSLKWDPLL